MTPEQKQVLVLRALHAGVRVFLGGVEYQMREGGVQVKEMVKDSPVGSAMTLHEFLTLSSALSEAQCARLAGLLAERHNYAVRTITGGAFEVVEG
jgi:hypothetical protein